MKLGKHKIIITWILVLFGCMTSTAQIQINWPGVFPRTISVGVDTIVDVSSLNIGQTGGPQTWNFDGTMLFPASFDLILPAGTPYANEPGFANAEWVYKLVQYIPEINIEDVPLLGTISIEDTTIEVYNYRQISGDWMVELGMGFEYPVMQGSPFVYGTPSQNFPNPLDVNSGEWLEKRLFNPELVYLIFTLPCVVTDSTIVKVNGWGNLTTPTGTYPCIQLIRHEFREIYIPAQGFIPAFSEDQESYSYMWVTYGFDMVLMVTSYDDQAIYDTADVVIMATSPVGVGCDPECEDPRAIPTEYTLLQNFPNPFNPTTSIRYALPTTAKVDLNIFSILGQKITTLETGLKSAGVHAAVWNGLDSSGKQVPGGIYFYQLKATPLNGSNAIVQTKKMIMTK